TARQRAQVTVAMSILHRLQLADDVVGAGFEAGVAGRGIHQAHAGEVVPGNVAREVAAISVPTTVRLRLWREAGSFAVEGEHPVRLELEEIARGQLLRVRKRPTRE